MKNIDRERDWRAMETWTKDMGGLGTGTSTKAMDPTKYYGGGQGTKQVEKQNQAKAWRELHRSAITTATQDLNQLASAEPLQTMRSKTSQATLDWEAIQLNTPIAGTEITTRRHTTLDHLYRLRTNPKYRYFFFLLSDQGSRNLQHF